MAVISQADGVLDLQLDNESVTQSIGQGMSGQQKFIAVKVNFSCDTLILFYLICNLIF